MIKQTRLIHVVLALASLGTSGCMWTHHDDEPQTTYSDPSVLIDTYEREVNTDCSGTVVSDAIVRHPAFSTIKINPDQNIYIASVSFFNLDNGDEFTPRNVLIPGPGGDNLKWSTFCQAPKPSTDCLVVHDGDNQVEYKYWSQENPDVMGEDKVRIMHFTVSSETSSKTCHRTANVCPLPAGANQTYSDCQY